MISTLAIAALFNPLRLRILAFIDRRFFRSRYDAEEILSQFSKAVRSEVDLDRLGAAMVGSVQAALQPEVVSLWITGSTQARPAAPRNQAKSNRGWS